MVVSSVVVLLFGMMFCVTFAARDQVEDKARDFVVEKTVHYSEKVVSLAESALDVPLTKKWLSDEQHAVIQAEIQDYHADPLAFVRRPLFERKPSQSESPKHVSGFKKKVLGWKEALRSHYNETLNALITDMRIFSGSNVVAGLLGFILAFRGKDRETSHLVISASLLLVAVAIGVYYYVDGMSFFKILFRNYLGWWYPVMVVLIFLYLFSKCRSREGESARSG